MAKKVQYIGTLEIKNIVDGVVTFTDGSSEKYTEKQLSYIVTDETKDLTAMRELVLANVVPEILVAIQSEQLGDDIGNVVSKVLDVIEAHNVRRGDFAAIMDSSAYKFKQIFDTTVKSYNEVFNQAIGKAFGTYSESKPSEYFFEDIRVSDMKKLIE